MSEATAGEERAATGGGGGEPPPPPTERARVRRQPRRGAYDRAVIDAILDEGLVAHVGLVSDGQPVVIPMSYARRGDELLLHGSVGSRLMQALAQGAPACVTVTLLDGVVLARSVFDHSMNYRSVVALGMARLVTDPAEKARALDALVEHLVPGRSADARPANAKESGATVLIAFPLDEASAKIRRGPPSGSDADAALPVWAGVVPLRVDVGEPEPAPDLNPGVALPGYLAPYRRPTNG